MNWFKLNSQFADNALFNHPGSHTHNDKQQADNTTLGGDDDAGRREAADPGLRRRVQQWTKTLGRSMDLSHHHLLPPRHSRR